MKVVEAPTVSVVINTLNRAASLKDTLSGIFQIEYPSFEVIVINGPSTDETQTLLERFSEKIKVDRCPAANLAVSRNIGINAASGEIVAFIDDDAVPHPMWLERLVRQYAIREVGGVGGFTIDRTGIRWQSKKTVCDRYGEAYFVNDFFDERHLNRPGSPFYPSLLGTNCSFRRSVLEEVDGFDETFAYLLDETDVCLRVVDKGHHVVYEPDAIVFHKGGSSDRRNMNHIPRTILSSIISKSYFIMRHGIRQSAEEAGRKLQRYREEIFSHNRWLYEHQKITYSHYEKLTQEVERGIAIGTSTAYSVGNDLTNRIGQMQGIGNFLPTAGSTGLRIVLVSRTFPPRVDAGIARWTLMLGEGLVKRGHSVHIITEADVELGESIQHANGVWMHFVNPNDVGTDGVITVYGLPPDITRWAKRVWREVQFIKSFGPIVVSFPIWDLEGIACLGDQTIGLVMSLHTSYAMAKPFKPEWNLRPLLETFTVNRMISVERHALLHVPVILANSHAIVEDLESAYNVAIADRVIYAPHGTADLLRDGSAGRQIFAPTNRSLRVLYVGRYEKRKGFDLALEAAAIVRGSADIEFIFVGGLLRDQEKAHVEELFGSDVWRAGRVRFEGIVERAQLEELYRIADVILMPSRYESFGLVAIEAMSAGKPVIALRVGGLKEVVTDGENGFLIDDREDAAERIAERLLAIGKSLSLYRRLARNARRSFENAFTIDLMAEQAETAYRRASELVASRESVG
jgi:glycosyltransferase involved in cell wall biosynthesis